MNDRALAFACSAWIALCLGVYVYQFHGLFGPIRDAVLSILGA